MCAHRRQEGTPYLHSFLVPHSISKSVSVFKPVRFQSCCMNQATIPPPPMPPLPVVEVWSSLTFRKQDFWEQNQILPNNLSYGLKQKLLSFKAPAKVCESMRSWWLLPDLVSPPNSQAVARQQRMCQRAIALPQHQRCQRQRQGMSYLEMVRVWLAYTADTTVFERYCSVAESFEPKNL